ncbi:MAG: sensor histidine kinase, partial [Cellulomonas sp.]|nr:sensor histidine kinase [Cellulomonas sp.]
GAGTGLGLALARDLVNADGGRLELAQRRPAVFALFLAGVPAALAPDVVLPRGAAVSSKGERRRR